MTIPYTIGDFDPELRSVPVTFTQDDIVFKRTVNAVLAADGSYDADGTASRVGEVALGVEQKIALGVITTTTSTPEASGADPQTVPPTSG